MWFVSPAFMGILEKDRWRRPTTKTEDSLAALLSSTANDYSHLISKGRGRGLDTDLSRTVILYQDFVPQRGRNIYTMVTSTPFTLATSCSLQLLLAQSLINPKCSPTPKFKASLRVKKNAWSGPRSFPIVRFHFKKFW